MNTILLVEDEPNQRLLCRMMLEDEGYRVLEAPDIGRALAMIRQEKPDLMVLDLGYSGDEGGAALHEVVALSPELPVVIYSGYDCPNGLPDNWAPDAYLVKSSNVDRLKATIEHVLATRHRKAARAFAGIGRPSFAPLPAAIGREGLTLQNERV